MYDDTILRRPLKFESINSYLRNLKRRVVHPFPVSSVLNVTQPKPVEWVKCPNRPGFFFKSVLKIGTVKFFSTCEFQRNRFETFKVQRNSHILFFGGQDGKMSAYIHLSVLLSQPSVSLLRKKQWSPMWTHPSGHSVQLIAVGWHGDRQIYKLNIYRKVQNKKQALNYHSSAEHLVPGAEQLCARSEYWLHMCLKRSFKDSSFSFRKVSSPSVLFASWADSALANRPSTTQRMARPLMPKVADDRQQTQH